MPKIITVSVALVYDEQYRAGAISRFEDLTVRLTDQASLEDAEIDWATLVISSSVDILDDNRYLMADGPFETVTTWMADVQAVVIDDAQH